MSSNTAIKENQLLIHMTTDMNLTCIMAVKEARLKRVQNIRFYLYDILENAKLWGQKTDQWDMRERLEKREHKENFCSDGLAMVMIQVYAFVKTQNYILKILLNSKKKKNHSCIQLRK